MSDLSGFGQIFQLLQLLSSGGMGGGVQGPGAAPTFGGTPGQSGASQFGGIGMGQGGIGGGLQGLLQMLFASRAPGQGQSLGMGQTMGQEPMAQAGNPLAPPPFPAPTPGGSFPSLPWNPPAAIAGPYQYGGGPLPGNIGLPIGNWQGGT